MYPISRSIESKTNVDVVGINIEPYFKKIEIPLYFIVAKDDSITPLDSVKSLHDNYGEEEKYLSVIEGEHHTERKNPLKENILSFVKNIEENLRKLEKKNSGKKQDDEALRMTVGFNEDTDEGLKPRVIKKSRVCVKVKDARKRKSKKRKAEGELNPGDEREKKTDRDVWMFT